MMSQFPPPTQKGIVSGIGGGRTAITSAQLTPSPASFNPAVDVTFDLTAGAPMSPPATPGQMIEVMEFDTVSYPSKGWVSRSPAVWAQVQPDTRFAVAKMSHFCTVALVTAVPGDPRVPQAGPPAMMHPSEKEVIAKANAEAAGAAVQNKALAAQYVAQAKTAKIALVTRTNDKAAADKALAAKKATDSKALADQKAKDAANQKRKELAEKKIEDLKEQKAEALAETRAIERSNRQAELRAQRQAQDEEAQQQQQQAQRAQQQQIQQQQMQRAQQQQQEMQRDQQQQQNQRAQQPQPPPRQPEPQDPDNQRSQKKPVKGKRQQQREQQNPNADEDHPQQ